MISDYFNREEFACNCNCGQDTIDVELITVLERVRIWADAPVTVNSGNRCPTWNKECGGSENSQHLLGRAADIVVRGKTPFEVFQQLNEWYPDCYGMKAYTTFTHIDTRTGKGRW